MCQPEAIRLASPKNDVEAAVALVRRCPEETCGELGYAAQEQRRLSDCAAANQEEMKPEVRCLLIARSLWFERSTATVAFQL